MLTELTENVTGAWDLFNCLRRHRGQDGDAVRARAALLHRVSKAGRRRPWSGKRGYVHRVGGVLDQFIARSEDGDAAVLQDAVVQSGVAGGRDDEERQPR